MITENYKRFRGLPNRLLEKYISRLDTAFPAYRTEYYARHFPEVPVRKICEEYVRGLCFVGTYYHIGMPDWRYAYPYHHGPFFHELSEYVGTLSCARISAEFERNEPLPASGAASVRPAVREPGGDPEGAACVLHAPGVQGYVPERVRDRARRMPADDYEGIVLLPPIRADAIRRAVGETEGAWTEDERRRNMHAW
jgi:5'-3' exoribonuclease 2